MQHGNVEMSLKRVFDRRQYRTHATSRRECRCGWLLRPQASDLKMEQKDRARFDRKVAFFATAGCRMRLGPFLSISLTRREHRQSLDTHALCVCRNVFRRKVAEMHRVQAVWLAALSILGSFSDADGRALEVVILRAAEETDVHQLPSAGNRFRVHIK